MSSWWDHLVANSGPSYITPGAIDLIGTGLKQNVADVDLRGAAASSFSSRRNLTIGGGYRYKSIEWAWIDGRTSSTTSAHICRT